VKKNLIIGAITLVAIVTAATIFVTYQWAKGVVDNGAAHTATSLTVWTLLLLGPILATIIGSGIAAWKKFVADERRRRERGF
jgi:hypothetical protein